MMDRDSLRQLRAQPGYLGFVSAATLARVSDEMFSVGVVLLVLDRTGSAALAGATVAAITFPSLVSGPLLGAWLDLTGRRRALMVIDQTVIASVLVALVALVGHGPDWLIPLAVIPAGITYPLSFGGFTSMIPALVPGELLPPATRSRPPASTPRWSWARRWPGRSRPWWRRLRRCSSRRGWRWPRWR
jgi:MFS family permease